MSLLVVLLLSRGLPAVRGRRAGLSSQQRGQTSAAAQQRHQQQDNQLHAAPAARTGAGAAGHEFAC